MISNDFQVLLVFPRLLKLAIGMQGGPAASHPLNRQAASPPQSMIFAQAQAQALQRESIGKCMELTKSIKIWDTPRTGPKSIASPQLTRQHKENVDCTKNPNSRRGGLKKPKSRVETKNP